MWVMMMGGWVKGIGKNTGEGLHWLHAFPIHIYTHSNPQDFLRAEVMPFYGNTHTTTSITGMQTTLFRHEARQIIAGAFCLCVVFV